MVRRAQEWLGIRVAASGFPLTDAGNAERLIDRHGADLLHCLAWKKWLVWDGKHWRIDTAGQINRWAKETARSIYGEAKDAADDKESKALAQHASRSQSLMKLKAMVDLARFEEGVAVATDHLDADPWLLNCRNGTLDLRTGELTPHCHADLLTKLGPVDYDPDATCPTWESFLERILPDQDVRAFVRRAVGYSLTGDTSEQVLFLLYGTGANGKSTFLETIRAMLGDHAKQADFTTLLQKRTDGARNDIARLQGARFVAATEVEGGRRLSAVTVKQLTGGDTVAARFLYGEHFEFRPSLKLWLAANHKPQIKETAMGRGGGSAWSCSPSPSPTGSRIGGFPSGYGPNCLASWPGPSRAAWTGGRMDWAFLPR